MSGYLQELLILWGKGIGIGVLIEGFVLFSAYPFRVILAMARSVR